MSVPRAEGQAAYMSERQRFIGGPHDGETIPWGVDTTTLRFRVSGEHEGKWWHTYTLFGTDDWHYMGILSPHGERRWVSQGER